MKEIETVVAQQKMSVEGVVSRLSVPALAAGFIGAVAYFAGFWPLGILGVGLCALMAKKWFLDIPHYMILEHLNKHYYDALGRFPDVRSVMPYELILYPALNDKERKEPLKKALSKVTPRALSNAVLFGQTLTLPIHQADIGNLGGKLQFNIVLKGKQCTVTSVRKVSNMELWEQARTAALKVR